MILLSCRKIPQSISLDSLESLVRSRFSMVECGEYVDGIMKKQSEESKCESLFALILLADLCDAAALDTGKLSLARDALGRPFFRNIEVDFSISHSCGRVAVALSDITGVGVDIEASIPSEDKAKKLAERYFSPSEQSAVLAASPSLLNRPEEDADISILTIIAPDGTIGEWKAQAKADRSFTSGQIFARIWTEKEALAKLCGMPLSELLSLTAKGTSTPQIPCNLLFRLTFEGLPISLAIGKHHSSTTKTTTETTEEAR